MLSKSQTSHSHRLRFDPEEEAPAVPSGCWCKLVLEFAFQETNLSHGFDLALSEVLLPTARRPGSPLPMVLLCIIVLINYFLEYLLKIRFIDLNSRLEIRRKGLE